MALALTSPGTSSTADPYPCPRSRAGTFSGLENRELVLHGTDVHIYGLRGPEHSIIDCSHTLDGAHGYLFLRGEHPGVTVSGLTLRKCLVEEHVQSALAAHPLYAAHFAGPMRWPDQRRGATFRQNRWLSSAY